MSFQRHNVRIYVQIKIGTPDFLPKCNYISIVIKLMKLDNEKWMEAFSDN